MNLTPTEFFSVGVVLFGILMAGTIQIRTNILLYGLQTLLVGTVTVCYYKATGEMHFLWLALAITMVKSVGISAFLWWVLKRIKLYRDAYMYLPVPLAMHACILLLGIAHFLNSRLPAAPTAATLAESAESGIALVLIGILFMMTRKSAVSQIIGFLTMENGIYLFTLSKAHGMPMAIELGIILDILVGVMIAGIIVFKIQKSFEHIDVTLLKDLKD